MICISSKQPNIRLKDDTITIYRMDHPSCVAEFVRKVNTAKKRYDKIIVKCVCERESIFPDACLPISALIENYKDIFGLGFEIQLHPRSYLRNCNFENPIYVTDDNKNVLESPLDKIFVYSSSDEGAGQVSAIEQAYMDCISRTTKCETGVLQGLPWCINEVLDNVLVHSGENRGYVMAQYHRKKKKLAICVFDCGMGIFNSLSCSNHSPKTEIDALTLALQEGTGDGKGQGNGLFGLHQIVMENGGKLSLTSGKSSIMLKNGVITKHNSDIVINEHHQGTIVDFQLDLSKKIDIESALKSIGGYDGFDIRIDNMYQDDDTIKYDVFENSRGTGTRIAGAELRNDVINTIIRTQAPISLDFSSVKTCSSSFIDEFIAKLITEIGFVEFNKTIKIINMNDFVSHLCNRAIAMRLHEKWEKITDK